MTMFRNYTYDDIKRFKAVDSFSFLQNDHFTSDPLPDILFTTNTETIKPKKDQERIKETIRQLVEAKNE